MTIFPGIELVYNNVNSQGYVTGKAKPDTLFEINHCREGRIEYEFMDRLCYLAPGDLSVACRFDEYSRVNFPLRCYLGITIVIDTEKAPTCLSCFLDDVNVSPENLIKNSTWEEKAIYRVPTPV